LLDLNVILTLDGKMWNWLNEIPGVKYLIFLFIDILEFSETRSSWWHSHFVLVKLKDITSFVLIRLGIVSFLPLDILFLLPKIGGSISGDEEIIGELRFMIKQSIGHII
jgi:hypothetical protein